MKKILTIILAIVLLSLLFPLLATASVESVPWRYETDTDTLYTYPNTFSTKASIGTSTGSGKFTVQGYGNSVEGPYSGPIDQSAEEENTPLNYRAGQQVTYRIYAKFYNAATNSYFYSNTFAYTGTTTIVNTFAGMNVYWSSSGFGTPAGYVLVRDIDDYGFIYWVDVGDDTDGVLDDGSNVTHNAGVSTWAYTNFPDLSVQTGANVIVSRMAWTSGGYEYALYSNGDFRTTATSTAHHFVGTGSASSTFAGGVDAARVCIQNTTTCLGAGGGATVNGSIGQLGYFTSSGSTIAGTSTNPLYVNNITATTTIATSTFLGGTSFGAISGSTGMRVYSDGKIRIGNAVPSDQSAPLTVDVTGSGEIRAGFFNTTANTNRTEFTVSNSASTNWTTNFVSFMIHGGSYAGNNYLTDGAADAGDAILLAQGSVLDSLNIGLYSNTGGGSGNAPLRFFTDDVIRQTIMGDASGQVGFVGFGTTSPRARVAITGSGTGTTRAFTIADSSNVEKVTVLDNGKVGIGTTSPNSLLTVGGTATSTIYFDSSSVTQGSCLVMKDFDGTGFTFITASNGVLTASTVDCR